VSSRATIRLAVTAQDGEGRSIFASDAAVEPAVPALLGGNEIWQFWGEDGTPQLPHSGRGEEFSGFYPAAGGHRFVVFTIPPASQRRPEIADAGAARTEAERLLPGITGAVTHNEGMHNTGTIDFLCVLEGEVWLELDGGESRRFGAGDCIVQGGTGHAWFNRHADQRAKLLIVFVGARQGESAG
jgi:hypothetical protein